MQNIKRMLTITVLAGATLTVGFVVPAASEGPPPHGHLLVTGLELDENEDPISWKKCRPLANGKPVPKNAHHEHLHTGRAGDAQWAAGNAAVPTAPLTPWSTCQELHDFFFGE